MSRRITWEILVAAHKAGWKFMKNKYASRCSLCDRRIRTVEHRWRGPSGQQHCRDCWEQGETDPW